MKSALFGLALAACLVPAAFAAPLDVFRDCDICPEMIELPMGEFVLGAPEDEFRRIVYWRDGYRVAGGVSAGWNTGHAL